MINTSVLPQRWVNAFPIMFWRSDLEAARTHLVSRFTSNLDDQHGNRALNESHGACKFDSEFDYAFSRVASSEPIFGNGHRKLGFSQFNILANFVLHKHPEGYTFHVHICLHICHPSSDVLTSFRTAFIFKGRVLKPKRCHYTPPSNTWRSLCRS